MAPPQDIDRNTEFDAIAHPCPRNGIDPRRVASKELPSPPVSNDGSRSPADDSTTHPTEDGDNDSTSDQIKTVFTFMHDLAAGMDEFARRMDKFEGVLDHLEIDGIRHTDEMRELKAFFGKGDDADCDWADVCDRLSQCERDQELLAERLERHQTDLLVDAARDVEKACHDRLVQCEREQELLAERLERHQTDLMVDAARDVEKACQESLQRVVGESVQKACDDAFVRLEFDMSMSQIADEGEDKKPSLEPLRRMQVRQSFEAGQCGIGQSTNSMQRSVSEGMPSKPLPVMLGTADRSEIMPNLLKEFTCSPMTRDNTDELNESILVPPSDGFYRSVSW